MNIQKLLMTLFIVSAMNHNQSLAMSLEQYHYTVSCNNPKILILIGEQMISGKLKKVIFAQEYAQTIRFVFPGNHFEGIDRNHLEGDLLIRVLNVAPNSYTVLLKSEKTNEQNEYHFDY